jgi:hypothetical protein
MSAGGSAGTGAAVTIVLRAPEGTHPQGRPVPIQVEVRNVSDADVWMVGVLDGSEGGVRYPHYLPAVTRDGVTVAAPGVAEDPLVGPLRAADFRRLAPGASFDPTRADQGAAYLPLSTFATWACPEAGDYHFVLRLSTASQAQEQWLGRFGQDENLDDVLNLIARVPRLTTSSNTLTVHVGSAST